MNKKSVVLAGDLHMVKKPGMWSGRAEISGDDIFALEQIAAITHEHDADLYLLGDVLDTPTNLPRPIIALNDALGSLAEEGRVFYIQGQHDMTVGAAVESYPWLSLIKGAKHISDFSPFDFLGMKAYALDYFPQAFEGLAFHKVPKDTELLLMHGTIDVAMPMSFHFSQESLKQFPNLKAIFAGDYHQAIELNANGVLIYYTGSTWQIAANEPREKSVILVTRDDQKLEISRVPLQTRGIFKLSELYNDDNGFSLEELKKEKFEHLPPELRTPVILIDLPTDGATMEKLAEYGHLYSTSGSNPDVPAVGQLDKENELSNSEILQRYADKEKFPDQFAFTLDVIENTTDSAVGRLREKLGIELADRKVGGNVEINMDAENPTE